ncbi:MAG: hypothetical protein ACP5N1_06345 [Candidatus Woesearchaeota archaeon]
MIGNKLEQAIIEVFQEDLSSTFSINRVSKILGKSYPLINKKSNLFLKEEILKKINVGNSYQCFLNMRNDKTRVLMALNEINKKELLVQKNNYIQSVIDEIYQLSKKFPIETVLLYKKTILFVMIDTKMKKELMELCALTKNYTLVFFDKKDFQDYFLNNKDLQKYHLILYNMDIYLNIISEVFDKILFNGLIDIKNDSNTTSASYKKKIITDTKKI